MFSLDLHVEPTARPMMRPTGGVLADLNETLSGLHRAGTPGPTAPRSVAVRASVAPGSHLPEVAAATRGATPLSAVRAATPAPRDLRTLHVTHDDAVEMGVRFDARKHHTGTVTTLLSGGPRRRRLLARTTPSGATAAASPASTSPSRKAIPPNLAKAEARGSDEASPTNESNARVENEQVEERSSSPSWLALQSRDVAILCRLAAVQSDHPRAKAQPQLRHRLPMERLDLRWIYDPARRPDEPTNHDSGNMSSPSRPTSKGP